MMVLGLGHDSKRNEKLQKFECKCDSCCIRFTILELGGIRKGQDLVKYACVCMYVCMRERSRQTEREKEREGWKARNQDDRKFGQLFRGKNLYQN